MFIIDCLEHFVKNVYKMYINKYHMNVDPKGSM